MNKNYSFQFYIFLYILVCLSACLYFILGYQTSRENFVQVISIFSCLFILYFIFYRKFSKRFFNILLVAGILFRLILLFSVPALSDDVNRFIWDGRLAANNINPFSFLPSEIITGPVTTGIDRGLFLKLNSPDYYSIYPPVLQGVFWLSAKLFPVNVFAAIVFMKAIILIVEILTIALIIFILKKLSVPKETSLLYILNPLVIAELTGNVHFDGLMLFCILLAFYLMLRNLWRSSALILGVGIAVKLIPVLFLPLLMCRLGWRKGSWFAAITGFTALVLFVLVFNAETAGHLLSSSNLFIRHFEFNASVYYVIRWLGTIIQGYNPIAIVGPLLYLAAGGCILFLSVFRKTKSIETLFPSALAIISIWYLFSTIVHPWYICLPVALSLFTAYRFPIIWSFTCLLSYSAYRIKPFEENLWLIGLGYLIVIAYGIWEFQKKGTPQTLIYPTDPGIK